MILTQVRMSKHLCLVRPTITNVGARNMKPLVIGCLVFLSYGASMSAQSDGPKRDLSKYEKAGPYRLGLSAMHRAAAADIRAFLWKHWSQRRLSTLNVTDYTKEGDRITRVFYIEPDQHGTWNVYLQEQAEFVDLTTKQPKVSKREYHIYKVERGSPDALNATTRFPSGVELPGDSYRLIFEDQGGKIVGQF